MKPKRIPARWVSTLVFLCGLYVLVYLICTENSVTDWLLPGAVALMIMATGTRWFFRGAGPSQ